MELNATRQGSVAMVAPRGRIDHLNADAFSKALAPHVDQCRKDGAQLLLDLSGLEYISSAGLRVLMLASKRAVAAGGRIGVAAPQPLVREILEISRFDLVFPVFASVEQGLAGLPAAVAG
jgi:anti-sigma B factor antagonist/stage II sporulation protein AA (anti-sigma F factor antagonist)